MPYVHDRLAKPGGWHVTYALNLTALALVQTLFLGSWLYGVSAVAKARFGTLSFPLALVVIGLIGVLAFWLCYALPVARPAVQAVALVGGFGLAWLSFRRGVRDADAAICVLLLMATTTVLLLWVFAPGGSGGMLNRAAAAWTHPLPADNALPLIFARSIMMGDIPTPLLGDWLSSDRPPLQTGLFLAFALPWRSNPANFGEFEFGYQIVSTAFQLLVVPLAYMLARALELSRAKAIAVSAALFFMPLTLVHGAYVWPKLLGAAFLMAAALIHFTQRYRDWRGSPVAGAAVGALAALAMLSHGTSAFSILGFGLAALVTGRWSTPRYAGAAIAAAILLYAPWVAYQTWVDPPGDRLMKWHVAGVVPVEDKRTAGEAVRDAYRDMGAREFVERQGAKIVHSLSAPLGFYQPWRPALDVRMGTFFNPLAAMGLLGLFATLSLPFLLFDGRLRPLAVAVLGGYAVWIVATYDTTATVVHQSSYFLWLALPILALALVARWPRVFAGACAAQVAATLYYFAIA